MQATVTGKYFREEKFANFHLGSDVNKVNAVKAKAKD